MFQVLVAPPKSEWSKGKQGSVKNCWTTYIMFFTWFTAPAFVDANYFTWQSAWKATHAWHVLYRFVHRDAMCRMTRYMNRSRGGSAKVVHGRLKERRLILCVETSLSSCCLPAWVRPSQKLGLTFLHSCYLWVPSSKLRSVTMKAYLTLLLQCSWLHQRQTSNKAITFILIMKIWWNMIKVKLPVGIWFQGWFVPMAAVLSFSTLRLPSFWALVLQNPALQCWTALAKWSMRHLFRPGWAACQVLNSSQEFVIWQFQFRPQQPAQPVEIIGLADDCRVDTSGRIEE